MEEVFTFLLDPPSPLAVVAVAVAVAEESWSLH